MRTKIMGIVLLFSIGFIACKKDSPAVTPPTYFKLNPEAIEFVKLPVNSYFIYKDSATGFFDSVIVTESTVLYNFQPANTGSAGWWGGPGNPAYYYESFSLHLVNVSAGQYWFNGNAVRKIEGYSSANPIIDSNFTLTDQASAGFDAEAFLYPFANHQQHQLIPILTIGGTTYQEVHEFITTNGLLPSEVNYQQAKYYWAKGTGIIKKESRTHNAVKTSLLIRHR